MAEAEAEAEADHKMEQKWRLHGGEYLGEISALSFLPLPYPFSPLPFLLAGTGSQLMLYDIEEGKLLKTIPVFEGVRVHGISCISITSTEESLCSTLAYKVAVYGEKRVKLFRSQIEMAPGSSIKTVESIDFTLLNVLPKLSHWVLDVCFLKEQRASSENQYLAIGCSNNSVTLWDILNSCVISEVRCPDRCLLYSLRLWGDELEALHIASGTIYNEIIVWKVVAQGRILSLTGPAKDQFNSRDFSGDSLQLHDNPFEAVYVCRLVGHEGSIFRIAWSSDGSKLLSVSDDRSARIWVVLNEKKELDDLSSIICPYSLHAVLFGHSARVWDCCISDSIIVTVGEDCTCRVWGLDGNQLMMIKDHMGRGIWRCLYEPSSSLLITGGFDSAIKVHEIHALLGRGLGSDNMGSNGYNYQKGILIAHIPSKSDHSGFMDSKSEYVRCLRFACEDSLYVATNHGYLFHASLSDSGEVKWNELVRVSTEVPIVCMDLLSRKSELSSASEDWIALGDGKGCMTVVRVGRDVSTPKAGPTIFWSAGLERQLLGTFWCMPLGYRHIFTADPRGKLKLWRLYDPGQASFGLSIHNVSLIAEFVSSFGLRIMCLDASTEEEVLVCGDLRGNLMVFPLPKGLLLSSSVSSEVKISPLTYFKAAHGISTVSSIFVARMNTKQVHIQSTGGDGCICYIEFNSDLQILEFMGMKQVKDLSVIQSVSGIDNLASPNHAIGFASSDFIIWNLTTETKAVQIHCGGWRRPHSYYLGKIPEIMSCFAYVKDETIFIHRCWVPNNRVKVFPLLLHMQFHGREMHSSCFISDNMPFKSNENCSFNSRSGWIATGCEDGTVRLTRYTAGVENFYSSKLLGEHVGGSAVRSLCLVSKLHIIATDMTDMANGKSEPIFTAETGHRFLLISAGAKRVLTSWQLNTWNMDDKEFLDGPLSKEKLNCYPSSDKFSSISFRWLSTDMPTKSSSAHNRAAKTDKVAGSVSSNGTSRSVVTEAATTEVKYCVQDESESDWRYLAVTAFLVKAAGSRLSVCFMVVACSDATLALRALVLPHRLWYDVALLVPLSSPVLALQHLVLPTCVPSDHNQIESAYIVIGGSTDGCITFWDLTESVRGFMLQLSSLQLVKCLDGQKRPRTGRGSQGGRRWRSLSSSIYRDKQRSHPIKAHGEGTINCASNSPTCRPSSILAGVENSEIHMQVIDASSLDSRKKVDDVVLEICEIQPLYVLNNVHQSGVNCLHVAEIENCQRTGPMFIVLSGGDDEALHCVTFELSRTLVSDKMDTCMVKGDKTVENFKHENKIYSLEFVHDYRAAAAHSSAVKGVWTDGTWAFSTGLDQRVRCWHLEGSKLTEHAYLILSVPEPESLDAKSYDKNRYQIVIAGRGMQVVEFSPF